jgi:hypothetical protein
MAIHRLLKTLPIRPEEIAVLAEAYEYTQRKLNLVERAILLRTHRKEDYKSVNEESASAKTHRTPHQRARDRAGRPPSEDPLT